MGFNITYGIGGWCSNCTPEHDHPFENIVEIVEIPEITPEAIPDETLTTETEQ